MTLPKDACWLITGCSTGLGRALAGEVLARGYRCVPTARDPSTLSDLAARHRATCRPVRLDVTRGDERDAAIAEAERAFGAVGVLVNNAGYGYYAAIEEGDDDEIRAMFDTNVHAPAALMRRVLPSMRRAGGGTIVNVSSVAGLSAMPAAGYYAATKFALEALSETLWKEAESLGIRVMLVEPGPFRTDFAGRSMRVARTTIDAYAATSGARLAQLKANSGRQTGDPARAAVAIVDALESPQPPHRLLLGSAGLPRVREKFTELLASIDAWEHVSRAADYEPDDAGKRP